MIVQIADAESYVWLTLLPVLFLEHVSKHHLKRIRIIGAGGSFLIFRSP